MGCSESKSTGTSAQSGATSGAAPSAAGSGPVVYKADASPPCRAVFMAMEQAKIKVQYVDIDVKNGEHKKPEYKKINPEATVPGLKDGDFCLGESRPIIMYLVDKYAPNHAIYPTDPKKRAMIERWLYFDFGTLAKAVLPFVGPQVFGGAAENEEAKENAQKAVSAMESMMTSPFLAGTAVTIADFCMVATMSLLEWVHFMPDNCPKVAAWYTKMKALPVYQNNSHAWKAILDSRKK